MDIASNEPSRRNDRRRRRSWRSVAWIVLLTSSILAGWAKAVQNRETRRSYEAAQAKCEVERSRRYPIGQATNDRIRGLFKSGPQSREVLEEKLTGGKPFVATKAEEQDVVAWVDPASGREFRLEFRGDQWTGWGSHWGSDANVPEPRPPTDIHKDAREQIRRHVSGFGPFFWALSLVTTIVLATLGGVLKMAKLPAYAEALRPHKRVVADAALALAILCTLAWIVSPQYTLTLRGVTSNDNLAFAAMMLAITIPVVAYQAAWRRATSSLRLHQFTVRAMLLLTALLAAMFAMAPFGYVVVLFAAPGAIWYWFASRLARAVSGGPRLLSPEVA